MPVVINFTLDPLRSWLKYRSKDNKASSDDYLEQALAREAPDTSAVGVASASCPRARVEVVSTSTAGPAAAPAAHEQAELAARLRQDVLFANETSRRNDDDEGR